MSYIYICFLVSDPVFFIPAAPEFIPSQVISRHRNGLNHDQLSARIVDELVKSPRKLQLREINESIDDQMYKTSCRIENLIAVPKDLLGGDLRDRCIGRVDGSEK